MSNHQLFLEQDITITRGKPLPLGPTIERDGINFALFSRHATSVTLILFLPGEDNPYAEFHLDPLLNKTGDVWHTLLIGINPKIEYGYRVDMQPNVSKHIHSYDPSVILVDPYAKTLTGGETWGELNKGQQSQPKGKSRRSLITDQQFDWGSDTPLNLPFLESIIYEVHVRGFTRHPSSCAKQPGTFAGVKEKIPHLQELGITAVELLPINEFEETDSNMINPFTGERLLNYWGYNSINYFAPKASYASNPNLGSQVNEFKSLVKALHEANIEVIVDVVFNHTSEGDERGKTHSFRGLDNSVYYIIDPVSGEYKNFTGCGNTFNCNHPVVRDMILECLRYWVIEMHVDGFRFDLASILGRGRDGEILDNPPIIERIAADPVLRNTKLIAEPWDAAGIYQVGMFPSGHRWAEWNGKYRDDVRKFVKSDPGMVPLLAKRLMGSPDLYKDENRSSYHSVNFITCHDGFTLNDLVSYNEKHNEDNGEDGRDGSNQNDSWNCGVEDPFGLKLLNSPDIVIPAEIAFLRDRQVRNFATLLMLSRGVPMILAGDEFGRTQKGNNNAYCQDNEISWIDWDLIEKNAGLLRFFKLLIKFRKDHSVFRHDEFAVPDETTGSAVVWHGEKLRQPDWNYESHCLAMQITEKCLDFSGGIIDIYLATNAHWEPSNFQLPVLSDERKWYRKIDTMLKNPDDILENDNEIITESQIEYNVGPRSVVVLIGK
ncbi:glycogen debranching enzyme GlgX [candidate division LCP-89 bacterium B3_LCP]|uniref:Glycogen debranching enzyme GlgX n=1 Tax=candidate division LCP-89 bacterium B3_LCP TaxID=2012998 RepID=A0A532UYX5_UNCL8|nr:MAG: glycogen debranching enzyme GlgX [candidate division LCP-89 bacterium B3_LCP]